MPQKRNGLEAFPLLFIDCQTTGMRPGTGSLLEIGWAWSTDGRDSAVTSRLCRLPEGETLPPQVAKITGLSEAALETALPLEVIHRQWRQEFPEGRRPIAFAHYAQFERSFLEDFFRRHGEETLPFDLFCTQQIARRLFPNLPSHNIRALAGHFGGPIEELNRAAAHVEATVRVWNAVREGLATEGLQTANELREWLKSRPARGERYEYRPDRLKRLSLPKRPGIYRMLSKNGDVLYVGKATSLKDRVNSYFRGRKGRDKRKLEMMAQVWDLETVECGSILEASLLENDEIKRLDPPYNVSLKAGDRQLIFYSRDFEDFGFDESAEHPLGPFKPFNHVEQLRRLQLALESGVFGGLFYQPLPEEDVREGLRIFLEREGVTWDLLLSLRSSMALALAIHRRRRHETDEPASESEAGAEEAPSEDTPTPAEIADKFERMFRRAGEENRRTRRLAKLLDARIRFESREGWRCLDFRRGRPAPAESTETTPSTRRWADLRIDDYDRMCVLLAELAKVPHIIEPIR